MPSWSQLFYSKALNWIFSPGSDARRLGLRKQPVGKLRCHGPSAATTTQAATLSDELAMPRGGFIAPVAAL